MIPLTCVHCEALILVLVPVTSNRATLDGFELVANARLSPVQLPEVDQLNVCGKPTVAPAEGLLNVAEQAATSENERKLARALNDPPISSPMLQK